MKLDRVLIAALVLIVVVDLASLAVGRRVLGVATGVVIAVLVLAVAGISTGIDRLPRIESRPESAWGAAISRRQVRAALLLEHVDGSRGEWDRYIRPLLAREFQLSVGYRVGVGSTALREMGRALFGPDLWHWVDPAAAAVSAQGEPGPGRETFVQIIDRMDRL
ncbi:hypothetical protein ABZ942_00295 [Nocardia sp. NPDC046473]|uniref:hypothetical protein n=1 Tax=Nocardia sp. NPDC046473 TaxID=3155733 RepID=UPI003410F6E2